MIDFSAIEAEIAVLVAGAASFKSTNTGRIREAVKIAEMPSADLSALGHRQSHRATASYQVDLNIVIRASSQARNTNAAAFKVLVEDVCAALEGDTGTSYDVLRMITSRVGEEETGDGRSVRVALITLVAMKN